MRIDAAMHARAIDPEPAQAGEPSEESFAHVLSKTRPAKPVKPAKDDSRKPAKSDPIAVMPPHVPPSQPAPAPAKAEAEAAKPAGDENASAIDDRTSTAPQDVAATTDAPPAPQQAATAPQQSAPAPQQAATAPQQSAPAPQQSAPAPPTPPTAPSPPTPPTPPIPPTPIELAIAAFVAETHAAAPADPIAPAARRRERALASHDDDRATAIDPSAPVSHAAEPRDALPAAGHAGPAQHHDPLAPAPRDAAAYDSLEIDRGRAHVVIGDSGDPDRVVVTIAMRGQHVDVNLRGAAEHMAGAVARSIDQLDDALRRQGLSLGSFTAGDGERGGHRPDRQAQAPTTFVSLDDPHDEDATAIDPRLRALA